MFGRCHQYAAIAGRITSDRDSCVCQLAALQNGKGFLTIHQDYGNARCWSPTGTYTMVQRRYTKFHSNTQPFSSTRQSVRQHCPIGQQWIDRSPAEGSKWSRRLTLDRSLAPLERHMPLTTYEFYFDRIAKVSVSPELHSSHMRRYPKADTQGMCKKGQWR